MMPAEAEDSTASMKRRRLSISSLALTSSSRWVRSSCVILLKVSPSWARSPSDLLHGHLDIQIAGRNIARRAHQPPDRRHQPVGEVEPDQHRGHQDGQRDHREHQRERHLDAEPARFDLGVFGDADFGLLELRDYPGIEQPRDIEEGVVEGAQPDHGRDVVAVGQHRDFRLALVDIAEEVRRRRREFQADAGVRRFQDVGVLVDDHRARQVARGGACGQQVAKRAGGPGRTAAAHGRCRWPCRECRRGSTAHAPACRRAQWSASSGSPRASAPRTAGRDRARW